MGYFNIGRQLGQIGRRLLPIALVVLFGITASVQPAQAVTTSKTKAKKRGLKKKRPTASSRLAAPVTRTRAGLIHTRVAATRVSARLRRRHRVLYNPWTEPTYADSTFGDNIDGEDLVVRKAAADALGPYNGTIVVTDTRTGRVLTIVNQKLGLKGAFQPCSTVKMIVSVASLSESIVDSTTRVRLAPRFSLDMTTALARSNNRYFAKLGEQLGFDRVQKYGKLFGLGEKAGLDIQGEEAGYLADQAPPTGVGMMTSFGDGIRLTPLELSSIVTTIANNGTMYYLQYPKNQADATQVTPKIKRQLDIARFVPEIKPGMIGAVEYGTARRAMFDQMDPVMGKTGTCTDSTQPGVHLGWFGSFNDVGKNQVAVVVLLTGGRGVAGPVAAGVAGNVYRNLASQNYFGTTPSVALNNVVSVQNCCRR